MRVDEAKRVLERELDRFVSIGWLASDWREQIDDFEIEVKGAKMSDDVAVGANGSVTVRVPACRVERARVLVGRIVLGVSTTVLCTESGREIEVPGLLDVNQEYDVAVTVTPRRWAPEGYGWMGDELQRKCGSMRYKVFDGYVLAVNPNGRYDAVPFEVIRAFDRAGLLK